MMISLDKWDYWKNDTRYRKPDLNKPKIFCRILEISCNESQTKTIKDRTGLEDASVHLQNGETLKAMRKVIVLSKFRWTPISCRGPSFYRNDNSRIFS